MLISKVDKFAHQKLIGQSDLQNLRRKPVQTPNERIPLAHQLTRSKGEPGESRAILIDMSTATFEVGFPPCVAFPILSISILLFMIFGARVIKWLLEKGSVRRNEGKPKWKDYDITHIPRW